MATRVIDDSKLQNIAVAIQGKDGGGTMTVDEMPGRIQAIPTGSTLVLNPALVLWDWEGTKLGEYSAEDALALTELPAPSTLPAYATADHELLSFQEWNWNLSGIKAWIQVHEGETLDVGAIYTTTDGQNHNYWGNPRLNTADTITMQKRGTASIGDNAFANRYSLIHINLPAGVTSIGSAAFQECYSLYNINIPRNTNFLNNVFTKCYFLNRVCIPDGIESITGSTFHSCYSIKTICIPDSVVNIGSYAFYNCLTLSKIRIPNNVINIGNYAFYHCVSLFQINIPSNITSIGENVFTSSKINDTLLEGTPVLSNTNSFSGLPKNYRIYVPRANLSWFETATNWSTIYTQGHIVAIEDYIEYLESLGFDVDDYKEVAP